MRPLRGRLPPRKSCGARGRRWRQVPKPACCGARFLTSRRSVTPSGNARTHTVYLKIQKRSKGTTPGCARTPSLPTHPHTHTVSLDAATSPPPCPALVKYVGGVVKYVTTGTRAGSLRPGETRRQGKRSTPCGWQRRNSRPGPSRSRHSTTR